MHKSDWYILIDGTYMVNYQQMNIPPYIPGSSK